MLNRPSPGCSKPECAGHPYNFVQPPERYRESAFGWPRTDTCAAKRSFTLHVKIAERAAQEEANSRHAQQQAAGTGGHGECADSAVECGKEPEFPSAPGGLPNEWLDCLEAVRNVFSPWITDCSEFEGDEWFEEQFSLALKDLDPQASTGLSVMSRYGSSIGDALGWDPVLAEYDPHRVELLKQVTKARARYPAEPDPILVFIKPEPHKSSKLESGRLRLISAVSLVDTMVDRVMYGWLQRAVLGTIGRTPALIGWSPYNGGYRLLTGTFYGQKALCVDKSSWDWTVQGWLILMVRDLIDRLAVGAPNTWREWHRARWRALFCDAVFGFRSGERIKQPGWGVMKSGCYLTILINSVCQVILHELACSRLGIERHWRQFFCVGDDTLQRCIEDLDAYFKELMRLGAVVKDYLESDRLEFCGHVMKELFLAPVYDNKHIFRVLHTPYDRLPDVLEAYQWSYCMDEEMWIWLTKLLRSLAPGRVRSCCSARRMLHG
nr:RNA-dependent RNA polymerase [Solemoviridae sp.]